MKTYSQFNNIAIPEFLDTPAFVDESYGNDITAHSRLITPEDSPYELWVFVHPTDPAERDEPDAPLYSVCVYEKFDGGSDLLDYTDANTRAECESAIQYHLSNMYALLLVARNAKA